MDPQDQVDAEYKELSVGQGGGERGEKVDRIYTVNAARGSKRQHRSIQSIEGGNNGQLDLPTIRPGVTASPHRRAAARARSPQQLEEKRGARRGGDERHREINNRGRRGASVLWKTPAVWTANGTFY
ncbi:unnamed protein product [Arctogadus glacialis]